MKLVNHARFPTNEPFNLVTSHTATLYYLRCPYQNLQELDDLIKKEEGFVDFFSAIFARRSNISMTFIEVDTLYIVGKENLDYFIAQRVQYNFATIGRLDLKRKQKIYY